MPKHPFLWLSPTLTSVGKRLGVDAHYFAKQSSFVAATHVVNVARGFVTGYLVVRFFSQEMYGEYQFILSVMGVIGAFGLSGLPIAIGKSIAKGERIPFPAILRLYGAFCSVGAVAMLAAMAILPLWGREELWPLFLVGALLFVPQRLALPLFGGAVMGSADFKKSLRVTLVSNTLVIVSVLLMLALRPSAILLLACAIGIPSVVFLWNLRPYLHMHDSKTSPWPVLRYGMQLTVATLPMNIALYLDKVFISALFGLNQLAVFSVAILIPEQIKALLKELLPVSFSRQAKGEDSWQRRKKLGKIVLAGMGVFAAGVVAYALLTPFVIPLLFPQYDAAHVVLLTNVSALTLIVTPGTLLAQYLEAQGMVRALQRAHWTAAGAFIVSFLALIPTMGLLGAVLARGVFRATYVAMAAWSLYGKRANRSAE